jgi:methyl-accepting chemotaxis protein
MKLQHRHSLKITLIGLLLAAVLLTCVVAAIALFSQRQAMLQERQDKIRNLVEVAYTQVKAYEDRAANGSLNEDRAMRLAKDTLASLHYDTKGSFFGLDKDLVYVASGANNDLVDKPLSGSRDGDGRDLAQLFKQAVQGGGKGFVYYSAAKAGSAGPQQKIAYLMKSPGWGWTIGTDVYLDDMAAAVQQETLRLGAQLLVVTVLLGLLGWFATRRVLGQLGGEPALAVATVQRIAAGQLDTPVPTAAGDRTSLLAQIGQMQDGLRTLVREIVDGSNLLAQRVTHINQSAQTVAEGSDKQSEAASAMASELEQVRAGVNYIAEQSETARALAERSGQQSRDGGEVIARAVGEIGHINEAVDQAAGKLDDLAQRAQSISAIMQVIKDVADQTNLLALNAAIEAARAGEQGRGFAVVADEVRKLAERTTAATEEIAGMIRDIQQGSADSHAQMNQAVARLQSGLSLAEQAGQEVGHIRHSAGEVAGVVSTIAQALKQQSAASQDIVRHVEAIVASAGGNAAAAQHSSQAIQELRSLADQLSGMVARFQL